MKRIMVMLGLLFTAPLVSRAQAPADRPLRIAIHRFDDSNVRNQIALETKQAIDYGKITADLFEAPLYRGGSVEIITRDRLEILFKEGGLKMDDRFDEASAPQLGRLLGVDAILTGRINELSIRTQARTLGIRNIGRKKTDITATTNITVSLISTQLGRTTFSDNKLATFKDEIDGGWSIGTTGNTAGSSGGANLADNYLRRAIGAAVDSLSARVTTATSSVQRYSGPVVQAGTAPAGGMSIMALKISAVRPSGIILNHGRDAGIASGEVFEVHRVTETVKDGEREIKITERIGLLTVQSVDQDWARATFKGDRASVQIRPTDILKVGAKP